MRVRTVAVLFATLLALASVAWAATSLSASAGEALFVQGAAPSTAFLGVSIYPRGTSTAAMGQHAVRQVSTGAFTQTFGIPWNARGGTYEVALWRKRVTQAQCTTSGCTWCARNGFHMEGLLAYRSGTIPASGTR